VLHREKTWRGPESNYDWRHERRHTRIRTCRCRTYVRGFCATDKTTRNKLLPIIVCTFPKEWAYGNPWFSVFNFEPLGGRRVVSVSQHLNKIPPRGNGFISAINLERSSNCELMDFRRANMPWCYAPMYPGGKRRDEFMSILSYKGSSHDCRLYAMLEWRLGFRSRKRIIRSGSESRHMVSISSQANTVHVHDREGYRQKPRDVSSHFKSNGVTSWVSGSAELIEDCRNIRFTDLSQKISPDGA